MLLAERTCPRRSRWMPSSRQQALPRGTFYYHFQSIGELAAAVGAKLGREL